MFRTIYIALAVIVVQCVSGEYNPVVKTQNGFVRGRINSTVWNSVKFSSFRGIPYAKPPVGDLRFQPPVPANSWDETWDATIGRNACIQYNMVTFNILGDEDCLFLNVYTPNTNFTEPASPKTVMFWIHGGIYVFDSGNSDLYSPDYFIEQDVVIVTINYRLGAFGFLSLNHPRALGNQGLKDQYLALQWVNKNIAAFGGDPNNVLIFGHSAGAASVGFHVLSEKTKGLFSRSLQMSGSPLCFWAYHTPSFAHFTANAAAAILGYQGSEDPEDLLNFFSTVPAEELAATTKPLTYLTISPYAPTVENTAIDYNNSAYVTECPINKYRRGNFNKQPMLIGRTDREAVYFLHAFIYVPLGKHVINYILQPSNIFTSILADVLNKIAKFLLQIFFNVVTDLAFTAPIDLTQRLVNADNDNNPIYYYYQTYQSPYPFHEIVLNFTYNGVVHQDDVPYVWNQGNMPVIKDPNDPYHRYQSKMVKMYTNYAKFGNPTPQNDSPIGITWTPSGSEGYQLKMNEKFEITDAAVTLLSQIFLKISYILWPFTSACRP